MAIISLVTPLNVQHAAEQAFFATSRNNNSLIEHLNQLHIHFNNADTERDFYREIFQLTLAVQPLLARGHRE